MPINSGSETGQFLRLMADIEHDPERRCACGRLIFGLNIACEVCDPEALPSLLRAQAA